MTKKLRIIIAVSTVVVIALLSYFIALPQVQGSGYISTVREQQPTLHTQVQRLADLFDREMFSKDDPDITTLRTDIKASQDVIADLDNQLSISASKVTNFSEYPLLSWYPAYKTSIDLKSAEKVYTDEARKASTEMSSVIKYIGDSIDPMAEIKKASEELADTASLETMDAYIAAFTTAEKKFSKVASTLKKIEVPVSLKEYHDYNLDSFEQLDNLIKKFIVALKSQDVDAIEQAGDKFQNFSDTTTKKADELFKDFVENSVLRQHVNKALETDRTIKKILG